MTTYPSCARSWCPPRAARSPSPWLTPPQGCGTSWGRRRRGYGPKSPAISSRMSKAWWCPTPEAGRASPPPLPPAWWPGTRQKSSSALPGFPQRNRERLPPMPKTLPWRSSVPAPPGCWTSGSRAGQGGIPLWYTSPTATATSSGRKRTGKSCSSGLSPIPPRTT